MADGQTSPAGANGSPATGLDWVLAWLSEAVPETKVIDLPQQTQWLTLFPAVPAYQNLLTDGAEVAEAAETGISSVFPETVGEAEEAPVAIEETPEAVAAVAPVPVPAAAPLPQAQPVAVEAPETPIARMAEQPAAVADVEARALPVKADKGELLWKAELTVRDQPAAKADSAVPAVSVQNEPAGGNTAGKEPSEDPSQQQNEPRKAEIEAAPRRSAVAEKREEVPRKETPAAAEKFESPTVPAPAGHATVAAPKAATAAPEVPSVAQAASVEADVARPMRPSQIATLVVDLPNAVDDGAPMRLAVSQRGDQVNVQLRSWDAATAPLDGDRMQPLLDSLADKGFVSAKVATERTETLHPLHAEAPRERHLAAAETAGSQTDSQNFQNHDDRQQRNQERQQQAFFLRRQMKSVQSDSFNLQALTASNQTHYTQGANQ